MVLRSVLTGLVAIAVTAVMVVARPSTARADATTVAAEYDFVRLLNQSRLEHGLAPLGVFAPLVDSARSWSAGMAQANALSHDPNIATTYDSVASPWSSEGENVGEGGGTFANPPAIHAMFMASPSHAANILGAYQYVAVGVVIDASGQMWVTERFLASPPKAATAQVPSSRIAGANPAETGEAVSRFLYPAAGSAKAVILGRNDVFADALAGGPLAVVDNGPLLLTDPTTLTSAVLTEIQRVLPAGGPVHLLGGSGAISDSVATDLTNAGFSVDRIFGANRYATAVAVSTAMGWTGGPAFLASGWSYPDALVAGPAAGTLKAPILLTSVDSLPDATASALASTRPTSLTVVGGTAVVNDAVYRAAGATERVGGVDRYDTSVKMAARYFPNATEVSFASGLGWQDALVAVPASARRGAPTLLLGAPGAAVSTFDYTTAHAPGQTHVWAFGDTGTLSPTPLIELYGAG